MTEDDEAFEAAELRDWARNSPIPYIKGLSMRLDRAKTDDDWAFAMGDLRDAVDPGRSSGRGYYGTAGRDDTC